MPWMPESPRKPPWATNCPLPAQIALGSIDPQEVSVELFYGPVDARGMITTGNAAAMTCESKNGDSTYRYFGTSPANTVGNTAYALRSCPTTPKWPPGTISGWYDGDKMIGTSQINNIII